MNLAGLTVGGKTVAGDAALSMTGGAKPAGDTRWGRQIGFILSGATLTYDGFAGVTEFTVHYSSYFDGAVDCHDGAPDGEILGSGEFTTTESWQNYADGRYEIRWPEGAERPSSSPVDTARLARARSSACPSRTVTARPTSGTRRIRRLRHC